MRLEADPAIGLTSPTMSGIIALIPGNVCLRTDRSRKGLRALSVAQDGEIRRRAYAPPALIGFELDAPRSCFWIGHCLTLDLGMNGIMAGSGWLHCLGPPVFRIVPVEILCDV